VLAHSLSSLKMEKMKMDCLIPAIGGILAVVFFLWLFGIIKI
jgi:hypothetical protein